MMHSERKRTWCPTLVFFFKNQKLAFWGGKNKIVLILKFQICIFAIVLYCIRKLHTNFHKKCWYLSPLEFFENENFDAHALGRAETSHSILLRSQTEHCTVKMHTAQSKCTLHSQNAHCEVKLNTTQSKCTLRGQTKHCEVKMHTAQSNWTLHS